MPGQYGTLGTPASGNTPGGRELAAAWTDANGNLWLFGGAAVDANGTQGSLNDLWEYDLAGKPPVRPPSPAPTPTFSLAAGSYNSAQTVTISDQTTGATIYYATNGTTPNANSSIYSAPIPVPTTETGRGRRSSHWKCSECDRISHLHNQPSTRGYANLQRARRDVLVCADGDDPGYNGRRDHLLHHQRNYADDKFNGL